MSTASTTTNKKQADLSVNKPKKKRQGRLVRSYEWFLELPVPIVLGAMWLAGVGLISAGVLGVYPLWLALESVLGG
jgi:hypothetical protein